MIPRKLQVRKSEKKFIALNELDGLSINFWTNDSWWSEEYQKLGFAAVDPWEGKIQFKTSKATFTDYNNGSASDPLTYGLYGYHDGADAYIVNLVGATIDKDNLTKILDIPLQKAKTRDDLNKVLNQTHDHDVVIIDTAGTNPHDPDDMARVARLVDAGSIEPILAMTAGVDAEESSEIAQSFALLGVQRMVATRLDIARRLGGLLSAAQKGGLAFCDISFTPKVTDGLSSMTPNLLAEFLINPDRALRSSNTTEPENKKTVGQKS